MAQTEGRVQQVGIIPLSGSQSWCCAWIGPSFDDAELFIVIRRSTDSSHRGAFRNSFADTLVVARANGKKVIVNHDNDSAEILWLTFND